MNNKAIGGYFGLDSRGTDFRQCADALLFNSGRSALTALLRADSGVTTVWVPDWYCPDVKRAISLTGLKLREYAVDESLEIVEIPELRKDELLVGVDYFGVKGEYMRMLHDRLGTRLIIDNCQSWWGFLPADAKVFYSPRKFFGVADGGAAVGAEAEYYAGLPEGRSAMRYGAVLERVDADAESGYLDFRRAERSIGEEGATKMSPLTASILGNLDMQEMRMRRIDNFRRLHNRLGRYNRLRDIRVHAAMAYPLLCHDGGLADRLRGALQTRRVYVARYWDGAENDCRLTERVVALPVDHRCDANDMAYVADITEKILMEYGNA